MSLHHPVFSRVYPALGRTMDRRGMARRRQELLAALSGAVVEVGAGDGLNFPHYPRTVTRVLAVEPEQRLRRLARTAAGSASVPVEVVDGLAERLPVDDSSVDAVVVSLVLCSVTDQQRVLREFRRVLKPAGQLRFLEHVRADTPGLVRVQQFLDATIWPHLAGGCHTGRDTGLAIEHAGFTLEHVDRFLFPDFRGPTSFYILGTAVR